MTARTDRRRRRPSAALVVASLALVVSFTDAPAYALATITGRDIVDETVTGDDITNSSLGAQELTPNSLTSAQIADGSLKGLDLADGTVTGREIANRSIQSSDIVGDTITSGEIGNGGILGVDIAQETITAKNIEDGSLLVDDFSAGLRTRMPLLAQVSDTGVLSSTQGVVSATKLTDFPGHYKLQFARSITTCGFVIQTAGSYLGGLGGIESRSSSVLYIKTTRLATSSPSGGALVAKQTNISITLIGACQ